MILVADASVLVAELLRQRGRSLFARPDLRLVIAEEQWSETEHELQRRLGIIVDQGRLTSEQARLLQEAVHALLDIVGERSPGGSDLFQRSQVQTLPRYHAGGPDPVSGPRVITGLSSSWASRRPGPRAVGR